MPNEQEEMSDENLDLMRRQLEMEQELERDALDEMYEDSPTTQSPIEEIVNFRVRRNGLCFVQVIRINKESEVKKPKIIKPYGIAIFCKGLDNAKS